MNKVWKICSIILLIVMCFSLFSITGFADDDEAPEVVYPFTVTYHFYYKDNNGNWKDMPWSQSVTSEGFNASKAISYFNKYVKTVTTSDAIYTPDGSWSSDTITLGASDRVYIKGSDFTEATEISFYANYNVPSHVHIAFFLLQFQE